jgi:O-antigen/teichoic acid export membrane protein
VNAQLSEASQPKTRLRGRVLRAAAWTLGAHGFEVAIRLVSNLILTRLLFPEAFGVVAAATALMVGLILVSDFGVRAVIVQSPRGDSEDFLRSAWVFQLSRGTLLWVILSILCGIVSIPTVHNLIPVDSVYANRSFPLITAVLGFGLVLSEAESTAISLNVRRLNFGPIALIDLACRIVPLPIIVVWAYVAPSVWALVAGIMAGQITRLILSHAVVPGPRMAFKWDKEHFQEIVKFGKWITVSSSGTFVAQQSDIIIFGFLLPGPIFGVYVIAKTLVDVGEGLLGRLNGALALPILSEVAREDRRDIRDRYYRFRLPIDLSAAVFSGALFVTGDLVVHVLYDTRYSQAGPMVQILAIGLAIYPVQLIRTAFSATGENHIFASLSLLQAASLILCMVVGFVAFGAQGAIGGIAVHRLAPSAVMLVLAHRRNWIDPWRELRVIPAFILGVVVGKAILMIVTAVGIADIRQRLRR